MNKPAFAPWACNAKPCAFTNIVAHGHDTSGGGGAAGGRGGGKNPHRGPQSWQSVPKPQLAYSAPTPPSSHMPSECRKFVSAGTCVPGVRQVSVHRHVCPGRIGGGGGGGGHVELTDALPHTHAFVVFEKYRQGVRPPGQTASVCSDVSAAQSPEPCAVAANEGPIVQSKPRGE